MTDLAAGLLRPVVIGTAGHIDHGKTALIRALTGVDTDRLPEEKRRGITIDLGFASLDAEAPDGSRVRIGFIDVPGHKLFVRNMLAGAGCVDAVLLAISAEDGVKPQTEEHLAICCMLGVRRGVAVITKVDAVSRERLGEVRAEIAELLRGTFLDGGLHGAGLLAVSARSGEGLHELRSALVLLAMRSTDRHPDRLARLPIDRAFAMKGFGTVITGTLLSGEFKVGQTVRLEPGGRSARVRGMQTHGRAEELVRAGSRVALNLAGIEVAEASRGQTLVCEEMLAAVATIDVHAWLLPGSGGLKHRSRVHFHAFTSATQATVSLYGSSPAEPGTHRFLRLKLDMPVLVWPGDRFVLRLPSPAATIGGGCVVDAHPLGKLRKAERLAWLEALKNAPVEEQLRLRVARRGADGLGARELMAETGMTREAIERMTRLPCLLRVAGERLICGEAAGTAMEEMANRVRPEGMKRSELRSQTGLNQEVFDFLIERLAGEKRLGVRGEWVYPFSHVGGSESPAAEGDFRMRCVIASIYDAARLATPASSAVAGSLGLEEREMRRLTTLLLREGMLVKVGAGGDYLVHRAALEKLRAQVGELRGQPLDVARFKQLTGLSRKYAIPLLEYLDRERITRKDGEQRVVL